MTPKTSLMIASLFVILPATAQAQPPATPATYVRSAGAGDLFEQTSSKLVLRSTKDAKVRSFATMMLQDHAKSSAMVKAAAAKSRIRAAPPQMTPDQKGKIAALTKASGTARDQLYWDQQKAAHREALALHQGYASTGTAEPLKTAAAKIVPVVQHHIEMLNRGGAHHK